MVDEAALAEPDLAEPSKPARASTSAGASGLRASRRPLVAGAAAGLWALLVGVAFVTCLVMLAWAVAPGPVGDSAAAWRASGMTWLGAHLVPMELGGRPLSLLPLGGLVLGLLLNRHGGRWAGRLLSDPTPGETVGIVTAAATVYGLGGAGLAWLCGTPGSSASPMAALLVTGVVALVGTTWGIASAAGLVEGVRSRLSQAAWRTIVGGLAAVTGLVAAGSVLVAVGLIRQAGQVTSTLVDLDAGVVGGAALTLLGVLCLPTLDVWGLSVIVGPGFQIGADNSLNAFGGQIDTLPALPVLAAVPATMPGWAPLLLLVPVALGGLAGRIRWGRDLPTVAGSLRSGAGLAGVVGALVAVLVLLASGSLGGGRLESVGPQALPVAGAAAGLVLLGFLADAGLQLAMLSWELHRAEQRVASSGQRADRGPLSPAGVRAASGDQATTGDGSESCDAADPVGAGSRGEADRAERSVSGTAPEGRSRRAVEAAARAGAGAAGALAAQGVSAAVRTVRTDRLTRSIPLTNPGRSSRDASPSEHSDQRDELAREAETGIAATDGAVIETHAGTQRDGDTAAALVDDREARDLGGSAEARDAEVSNTHETDVECSDAEDSDAEESKVEHSDIEHSDVEHTDPEDSKVEHSDPEHTDPEHTIDLGVSAQELEELRAAAWGSAPEQGRPAPCPPAL